MRVGVGVLVHKALKYWGGEVAIEELLLVALLVLESTLSRFWARNIAPISTDSGLGLQYLIFQGTCANSNGTYYFSCYTLLCYGTADFNKILYE